MHLKVLISDKTEFTTGSFNFTNNAAMNNNESLVAWRCASSALLFQQEFDRLWDSFRDVLK